jgi:predicted aconitase with swiveling domain
VGCKERVPLAPLVPGQACGELEVSAVPLSFWGGFDPRSGRVTDVHHDLYGRSLAGKVLVIPASRGSSSSSGVLLESIRLGACPAAIISQVAEPILAIASIIAREIYGWHLPVATISQEDRARLRSGQKACVRVSEATGELLLENR